MEFYKNLSRNADPESNDFVLLLKHEETIYQYSPDLGGWYVSPLFHYDYYSYRSMDRDAYIPISRDDALALRETRPLLDNNLELVQKTLNILSQQDTIDPEEEQYMEPEYFDLRKKKVTIGDMIIATFKTAGVAELRIGTVLGFTSRRSSVGRVPQIEIEWDPEVKGWGPKKSKIDANNGRYIIIERSALPSE